VHGASEQLEFAPPSFLPLALGPREVAELTAHFDDDGQWCEVEVDPSDQAGPSPMHTLERRLGQSGLSHQAEEPALEKAVHAGVDEHRVENGHADQAATTVSHESAPYDLRCEEPEPHGAVDGVGDLTPGRVGAQLDHGERRAGDGQPVDTCPIQQRDGWPGADLATGAAVTVTARDDELERTRLEAVETMQGGGRAARDECIGPEVELAT